MSLGRAALIAGMIVLFVLFFGLLIAALSPLARAASCSAATPAQRNVLSRISSGHQLVRTINLRGHEAWWLRPRAEVVRPETGRALVRHGYVRQSGYRDSGSLKITTYLPEPCRTAGPNSGDIR